MPYFILFVIVASILAAALTRVKPHEVTKLENAGKVLTVVLILLYIPISYVSLFTPFFLDNPTQTPFVIRIMEAAIYCGILIPIISPISLGASVILRKRGKSIASFIIQFIPLVLFCAVMTTLITLA